MVGRQMQLACARVPLINQSVEEKTGRSHKSSNRHHHIDNPQNLDKSKSFDTLILFWCSETDIPVQYYKIIHDDQMPQDAYATIIIIITQDDHASVQIIIDHHWI